MRTRTKTPQTTPINHPPGTNSIHRPGPSSVTYHIPTTPSALKTTIHLPPTSHWISGLHFHTSHTEHIHLLTGIITIRLGRTLHTYSARAGGEINLQTGTLIKPGLVVTVEKYVRHDWGRSDFMLRRKRSLGGTTAVVDGWGEDVVVEEWVEPGGVGKPVFFWNLNGVVTAPANEPVSIPQKLARWVLGGWWVPFQLFVVFWELDNWPVFLDLDGVGMGMWVERRVEFVVTFLVLGFVSMAGRVLGVEAVAEGRTPKELREAWQMEKAGGRRDE